MLRFADRPSPMRAVSPTHKSMPRHTVGHLPKLMPLAPAWYAQAYRQLNHDPEFVHAARTGFMPEDLSEKLAICLSVGTVSGFLQ